MGHQTFIWNLVTWAFTRGISQISHDVIMPENHNKTTVIQSLTQKQSTVILRISDHGGNKSGVPAQSKIELTSTTSCLSACRVQRTIYAVSHFEVTEMNR